MKQEQFLDILDRDEAEARWKSAIDVAPPGSETIPIEQSLSRVLAENVRSEVDVPGFDRSNMDGFAVRAVDTFGASEREPVTLRLAGHAIDAGHAPEFEIERGTACAIATGGVDASSLSPPRDSHELGGYFS